MEKFLKQERRCHPRGVEDAPLLIFILLVTKGVPSQCQNACCQVASAEGTASKDCTKPER